MVGNWIETKTFAARWLICNAAALYYCLKAITSLKARAMTNRTIWHGKNAAPHIYAFSIALVAASALVDTAPAEAPKPGDPPEANNMRLIGYNDLQGRSACQPA